MSKTTAATIQLLILVVVAAAIVLLGVSTTHYTLYLAVLRLLNTWLQRTDGTPAGRRPRRRDEQKPT